MAQDCTDKRIWTSFSAGISTLRLHAKDWYRHFDKKSVAWAMPALSEVGLYAFRLTPS
jgi:hypothetical protein